jgi:hypothetical protein
MPPENITNGSLKYTIGRTQSQIIRIPQVNISAVESSDEKHL